MTEPPDQVWQILCQLVLTAAAQWTPPHWCRRRRTTESSGGPPYDGGRRPRCQQWRLSSCPPPSHSTLLVRPALLILWSDDNKSSAELNMSATIRDIVPLLFLSSHNLGNYHRMVQEENVLFSYSKLIKNLLIVFLLPTKICWDKCDCSLW